MLRRFVQNTAISAVAYALAGVLGLFAVGVIARSYGVAVLGLIVLARAFLPTGFFSLIDFGVTESTTQCVARGRVGDWAWQAKSDAADGDRLLRVVAAIALRSHRCCRHVRRADQADAFIAILRVTVLCFRSPFSAGREGRSGFEHGWLRLTEVGGNALYVAAVYALIWRGAVRDHCYSYLAMTVAKYVVLAARFIAPCTTRRFCVIAPSRRDVFTAAG